MINSLIEFSIKNKFFIGLLVVAMIGGGIYSMATVNLGSVPDITNNQVQIITVSPNLSTEDIEQFVTYPVELSMGNLPGLVSIRSISRFGLSVVTVIFEDNMGTYLPRQLVQEQLNDIKGTIPEQFGSPAMGPITTGLGQIYEYTIEPLSGYESLYSPMELRTIQDWLVKRQMMLLEGVVEVNSFGGFIKQYEIAINPEKLNAMNVSLSEVFQALSRNNVNTGGAYIEKNRMANFIRGEGLARSLDDIRNIPVRNENGIPLLIKDVAEEVYFGHQVRYGAFTKDGKEAVGGMVMMLKGSNPNAVIRRVKDRMNEIQQTLPEGLQIKPFLDRSELIGRTTNTVKTNLMEGALIVVFVLVILLGSLRGGLITASVIPLSLLFAFILMKLTNVWANLMSLGAIDFGIIVDGAVIIVEGTVYQLEKKIRAENSRIDQQQMDQLALKAGSTMMNSAFFGQLIILIVFAPILFLTGIEGKMFRPMAFTFGFALLGAIILCLTYVPMVSALFMKPSANKNSLFARIEGKIELASQKLLRGIKKVYLPLIKGALDRKPLVLGIAVVLFGVAGYTFSRMGGEFMPQLDEGDIAMQALIRPGSALGEAVEVSKEIEDILLENFPEIKTVTSRIGVADIPTDPMPMDIADMYLILEKDQSKWVTVDTRDQLIAAVRDKLGILPGVNLLFTQPVELRFNELLQGVREDVSVKLYGEDLDVLATKAREIAAIIKDVPGAGDVNPERITGLPQMTIRYDRKKVAQYGLNIEKLNDYVSVAFAGGTAGVVFEGEKRFDMVIRFDEANRKSIDDLRTLYIDMPDGAQVPIKEVADIDYVPGPMQISREDTFRRTYVGVNVRGRDVESVVTDIREKLDQELSLPPGYHITYGGEFENFRRAKERLTVVVPIALFLIFVLLYFALNSFSQSLMIYMAIPLAAIGGVFSLTLRGMPFSISAGVGFIVLFGVAVLNGLVLISRFNSLKLEDVENIKERILIGTEERLRPILLTAIAAITGFTPMAFSTSAGAEVQRPLATVVIGGLISATLLTLVVVPVLYHLVEIWARKRALRFSSKASMVSGLLMIIGLATGSIHSIHAQGINTHEPLNPDSLPRITLEDAVSRAVENYPKIKAAALEVNNQEVLKKTAWNLGNTQLFTAKEEVGNESEGVNTRFGIQQQQVDVFGISPRLKLQQEKVALAEITRDLTELQVKREVSRAWVGAYTAMRRYRVYQRLDSVFIDMEKAARILLETEATSKLEFLATINQSNQVKIRREQAFRDYLSALQQLNMWWGDEGFFSVASTVPDQLDEPLNFAFDSLAAHPLINLASQQVNVADALIKEKRSQFYPQLQGQYGWQEIGGEKGFYTYQFGVRIPLFFGPELGYTQSARIRKDIAYQELQETKLKLGAQYRVIREQYLKWLNSWGYYKDQALPLAREQQTGAITAYREGAIDYVTFLQNIRDAIRIEVDGWEAFGNYLDVRYQLQYYLKSSN